jgi:peptide/nickel transport system substrate-binding protein
MKKNFFKLIALMTVISFIMAACGGSASTQAPAATSAPAATNAPAATSAPTEGGLKDVPRNKTLVLGWWGENTTFKDSECHQPFGCNQDFQQGTHLNWEGMAYWNAFDNKTTMWQAESYSYNADFTELTIKLRPEVMWSDGTPFTADDVVYTVNTLRDLGPKVRFGPEVKQYTKEASKVDDHTVLITLNGPDPRYFWRFFTWRWDSTPYPIVPKHIWEGQDWATFGNADVSKGQPVSTGPLQLVFTSPERKVWDRRDNWWAVKAGLTDEIKMERVINIPTGGQPTVLTELMVSNQIDITHLGADTARVASEKNPKITTHSGRNPPYGYTDWWPQSLWLKYTVKPFDNPDVRWCISYSIDRQNIIDVAWEGNNAMNPMPYPPYAGLLQYTDSIKDLLEKYNTNEFNLDKAAERCQAAGYTKDSSGMWVNASGEKITIPLMSWLQWDAGSQVLTEQLKQNGFDASFSDPPDAWSLYTKGEYVAYPAGHAASLQEPYDAMNLYKCPKEGQASYQVGNLSGWCDPEFDKLIQEMQLIPPDDFEKNSAVFRKMMELWLPALPDLPLFNWMHNFGMNETYWTNWPTVDNTKDGEYINEASQLLGFLLILTHLEPTGAP